MRKKKSNIFEKIIILSREEKCRKTTYMKNIVIDFQTIFQ